MPQPWGARRFAAHDAGFDFKIMKIAQQQAQTMLDSTARAERGQRTLADAMAQA